MKIKNLKKELAKHDEDMEIYLSSDSEGNSYNQPYSFVVIANGGEKKLVIYPDDSYLTREDIIRN